MPGMEEKAGGKLYWGFVNNDEYWDDVYDAITNIIPAVGSRKKNLFFNAPSGSNSVGIAYEWMPQGHHIIRVVTESSATNPLHYTALVANSGDVYFFVNSSSNAPDEPQWYTRPSNDTFWRDGPDGIVDDVTWFGCCFVKTVDLSDSASGQSAGTIKCAVVFSQNSNYNNGPVIMYGDDLTSAYEPVISGRGRCPHAAENLNNVSNSLTVLGPIWNSKSKCLSRYTKFLASASAAYPDGTDVSISGHKYIHVANGIFLDGESAGET